MGNTTNFDWKKFRQEWQEILQYLKNFFKNPIQTVRFIPNWNWQTIIFFQASIASISGGLSGIVSGSISKIILGFIFIPITTLITVTAVSGFFYYFFMFVLRRQVDFKQLFSLLVIANIPFMILYILSPLVHPLIIIGLAATGILLIVGFIDYFALPKKSIIKVIVSMFLVYTLLWIIATIDRTNTQSIREINTTQESLDILEKELRGK